MFPEVLLPHVATVKHYAVVGHDANLNPITEVQEVIKDRPARVYREGGELENLRRRGITAEAVITFAWKHGDEVAIGDIVLADQRRWEVSYAYARDGWADPIHWEIALTSEAS